MRKTNNYKIPLIIALFSVLVVSSFTAFYTMTPPEEPAVGGGPGTINQLSPFTVTGGYVKVASSTAGFQIPALANCDTIDTDGDGKLSCGTDASGGGGGGSISTSTTPTPGHVAYWTSPSSLGSVATGTLTTTATGLSLDATRGLLGGSAVLSLGAGYVIPLSASTTEWATAYGWGDHSLAGYLTSIATTTVRGMFSATSPITYNSGTGAFGFSNPGYITGVAWGDITGTLSNQTDLQLALDAKLSTTTAASTYYLQTNPSAYISNITGLITEGSNVTITGAGTSGDPYEISSSGSGGGGLGTTTPWTAGQLAVVATDGLVKSVATSTLSENVTGLEFDASPWIIGSGRTLSLSSGYTIPLSASTTEWTAAHASTTALTPSYMRGLFSNTATGLTYNSSTGATSLTSGYIIPLSASTTEWTNFYNTPSTRITAGTGLSWSNNTLNASLADLNYWRLVSGGLETASSTDFARAAYFTASSTTATSTFAGALTVGTNRLVVNTNGNVGIGTTTPGYPLAIVQSGTSNTLQLYGSSVGYRPSILFSSHGDGSQWQIGYNPLGSGNTFYIRDNDAGVNVVTIEDGSPANSLVIKTTTGNVGIGTTTPATKLHVSLAGATPLLVERSNSSSNSNIEYRNTGGSVFAGLGPSGTFVVGSSTDLSSVGNRWFQISNSIAAFSNVNVGIGDTTPAALLTVGASDAFQVDSTGRAFANFGASGAGNLGYSFVGDTDTGLYRSAANEIRVQTAGTDAVTITGANRVGIGTTTPSGLLHVNGGDAYFGDSGNNPRGFFVTRSGTSLGGFSNANSLFSLFGGTSVASHLVINTSGNVGIGDNTPASPLTVGNGDLFQVNSSGIIAAIAGLTGATGSYDLGGATFLEIPNGTNPTADDPGEIAHDTTDNQLIVDDFVMARAVQKIWSVTVSSSSPAFINGSLLKVPTELDGYTMTAIRCSVQGGTSKVIAVEDESGNSTEDITCTTSVTSDDGTITNASVTAAEKMYIDFGATSGTVDYVSVSVFGTITRE